MSSLPLLGDLLQGDYMKCPLCHNTYSEPVILPCLHSTCLGCIRNHLAEVKGQGSSTDSSEGLTKEAAQLRCPVCQEGEFEFHGQQLVGWSPNYFLRGLEVLHFCKDDEDKYCDYCKYDNRSCLATCRCIECLDNICDNCGDAHRRTKITRRHMIVPFTEIKLGKYDQQIRGYQRVPCEVHPEEGIRYYCGRCEKLICKDCKISEHENHHCSDVKFLMDTFKEKAKGLISGIKKRLPGMRQYVSFLSDYEQHLKGRKREIVEEIESQADLLHRLVDEYKQQQILEVTGESTEESKVAAAKRIQAETLVNTLHGACSYLDTMFDHGKPEEVMTIRDLVINRLTSLAAQNLDPLATKLSLSFTAGNSSPQALEALFGKVRSTSVPLNDHNIRSIFRNNDLPISNVLPTLGESLELVSQFECRGLTDRKDIWPTGLAVTADGHYMVLDRENKRLKAYDKTGNLLSEFGEKELSCPYDIAIMQNGNLAITDYDDEDVKVFTPEGTLVAKLKGPMKYPRGIAVSANGQIVIVDAHSQRLIIHEPQQGKVVRIIEGKADSNGTQLTDPYYVACNDNGNLVVTDWGAPNLKIFSPDGKISGQYGTYGIRQDQCLQPYGVCIDRHGYIFMADNQNHRIHLLGPDGKFIRFVITRQQGLWHPMALAINPSGHLVVTEALGKVKTFRYM